MGWSSIRIINENKLMSNITDDHLFYFVHSFHFQCYNKNDVLGVTNYGYEFTSCVEKDNVFGTQFHSEKSHDSGIQIIKNFIKI